MTRSNGETLVRQTDYDQIPDRCLGIMGRFQITMSLSPGKRLAHDDATALLGEGGRMLLVAIQPIR